MIKHESSNKDGGFFKKARKAFPMFPFTENRMKWDDYGELVTQEDYRQISQADNQVFYVGKFCWNSPSKKANITLIRCLLRNLEFQRLVTT